MPKYILLALGVLVIAVALVTSTARPVPCTEGCNVILIMIDTLSAQHLATYGYGRDTLPRTTAFFERNGVIFDHASSNAAWTLPSFTSMYFSDLASDITYKELGDDNRPSLQRELRNNDYTLRAVVPSPTFFILEAITEPFTEDELYGIKVTETRTATFAQGRKELSALEEAGNPFFLLIHTFEAHDPYMPSAPYNQLFATSTSWPIVKLADLVERNDNPLDETTVDDFRLRYDQGIAQADTNIANFLESISPETLKNTVIILSADHGEAFGEHDKIWHANNLHQEEVHVPLMMRVPSVARARIAEPVSNLDIAPTILSLAGIAVPETFQGDSLVPLLRGKSMGERVIPFVNGLPYYAPSVDITSKAPPSLASTGAAGTEHPIIEPATFAVRIGDLKLIQLMEGETQGVRMLYDLSVDPGEQHDLLESGAEVPQELSEALDTLIQESPIP